MRSGCDSITVSPKTCSIVTGKAPVAPGASSAVAVVSEGVEQAASEVARTAATPTARSREARTCAPFVGMLWFGMRRYLVW